MTSGRCNKFNYFPENQLCPHPTSSFFCPPRISVTHFGSLQVPLDAPTRFLLPFSSHSLSLFHRFSASARSLLPLQLCLLPQLSIPSCLFPLPPSFVLTPVLKSSYIGGLGRAASSAIGPGRSPTAKCFCCIFRLKYAQFLSLA